MKYRSSKLKNNKFILLKVNNNNKVLHNKMKKIQNSQK